MKVVVRKSRSSEHYLEVIEVVDEEREVIITLESSVPIPHDEVVRELESVLKLKERLEQLTETTKERVIEPQQTKTPSESSPEVPQVITLDSIMRELRTRFRFVPEDDITRILVKGAERVGLGHEKIRNANPEELQRLYDYLFSPIGENGVQNVLAVETVLSGEALEIPKDQELRRRFLGNARQFARMHYILSRCPDVDKRIDEWTGAFFILYEYYRLFGDIRQ